MIDEFRAGVYKFL